MIALESLLLFYLSILLGFSSGVIFKKYYSKAYHAMLVALIYFLLPLIVFKSLLDEIALVREIFLSLAIIYLLAVGISFVIGVIFLRDLDRFRRCSAVLSSTLRNAFFIPIALVMSLDLPEAALVIVIVFTMFYHLFQPFFTLTLAVRAHGSYAIDIIIKGVTFPPLRAAIFGIFLGLRGFNISIPSFEELKLFTSYFSLFYVGFVLSKAPMPSLEDIKIVLRVASIRLLIVPLLLLPIAYRFPRPISLAIILEVGAPTSVSAVLYAALFGFDDELVAKIVVYVTFIGVLVMPLRTFLL